MQTNYTTVKENLSGTKLEWKIDGQGEVSVFLKNQFNVNVNEEIERYISYTNANYTLDAVVNVLCTEYKDNDYVVFTRIQSA